MKNNKKEKCIQKKFILIKYKEELKLTDIPNNWSNYINVIYFIEEKGYNFLEFNDIKSYNLFFKNNKQSIIINKESYYLYKVNKNPFLLNEINKILFWNFTEELNIKLNTYFILNIFGILFEFEKILIVINKKNFNTLLELKDKKMAENFKKFLDQIKKDFKFQELIVYFSKKKKIINSDKNKNNNYNNKYFYDKNLEKNNENKYFNNFEELNKFFIENLISNKYTKYENINKDKTCSILENEDEKLNYYDLINKLIIDDYYCIFLIDNILEINKFIKFFYKFLLNYPIKFQIIINKNLKYNKWLWLLKEKDKDFIKTIEEKFSIKLEKYKKIDKLLLIIYINQLNVYKLINFISSNINILLKKFILKEFYSNLIEICSKLKNKIFKKSLLIKKDNFDKKIFFKFLKYDFLFIKLINKEKNIFIIIFKKISNCIKLILENQQIKFLYFKLKKTYKLKK